VRKCSCRCKVEPVGIIAYVPTTPCNLATTSPPSVLLPSQWSLVWTILYLFTRDQWKELALKVVVMIQRIYLHKLPWNGILTWRWRRLYVPYLISSPIARADGTGDYRPNIDRVSRSWNPTWVTLNLTVQSGVSVSFFFVFRVSMSARVLMKWARFYLDTGIAIYWWPTLTGLQFWTRKRRTTVNTRSLRYALHLTRTLTW
jgi:hypothetical protein